MILLALPWIRRTGNTVSANEPCYPSYPFQANEDPTHSESRTRPPLGTVMQGIEANIRSKSGRTTGAGHEALMTGLAYPPRLSEDAELQSACSYPAY